MQSVSSAALDEAETKAALTRSLDGLARSASNKVDRRDYAGFRAFDE
jgi:hypothetical protein